MSEPIVSRESIRAKARSAYLAGRARDEHNMNPGSPALADWLAEYDRIASISILLDSQIIWREFSQFEITATPGNRVEQEQGRV